MSQGYFELKTTKNNQYHFVLKAANHEVILSSETYTTKASALNGIKSVQENSQDDKQFERKISSSDESYFALKAKNHEIIGQSEMYSSTAAMETGIASVKVNGLAATVKELETI